MSRSRFVPVASITTLALSLVCCGAPGGDPADQSESDLRSRGGGDDTGGGSGSGGGHTITTRCYQDADGDGYTGTTSRVVTGYKCPAGWSTDLPSDCNDASADWKPRGCSRDADGDGHPSAILIDTCTTAQACAPAGDDCNDYDATIFPKPCQVDADGDGYPGSPTMCVASCPSVPSNVNRDLGDCDDGNAQIHFGRHEIPGNGIDDNCSSGADEAEFFYSPDTGYVGSRSLTIPFSVNEITAINGTQSNGGKLFARVTYAPLAASKSLQRTAWIPVALSNVPVGNVIGTVTLDGLQPSTPYHAWLDFAADAQGAQPYPTTTFAGNDYGTFGSREYFGMTLAESSDRITQIRPVMVDLAIEEWNRSQLGEEKAGTTYCSDCDALLGPGHYWCSEFYDWVAGHWFEPMNVSVVNRSATCQSVADAFQNHGGTFLTGNLVADEIGSARPGDYLPITFDKPSCSHSQMFLAYDATLNKYWWIAGNVANTVAIGTDGMDPNWASGIGVLTTGMLK